MHCYSEGTPCSTEVKLIDKSRKFIQRNIRRGNMILDVGCGYGIYIGGLSNIAKCYIGLDISMTNLTDAMKMKENNTMFVCGTAERLPFQTGSFDAIICIETLEHIPSDEKTVKEFARILKPGGRLIITGPNKLLPFETLVCSVGGGGRIGLGFIGLMRRFRFIPARLRRRIHSARDYTPRELKKLLTRNRFEIKQLDFLMPTFEHSGKDYPKMDTIFGLFKVFNFLGGEQITFKKGIWTDDNCLLRKGVIQIGQQSVFGLSMYESKKRKIEEMRKGMLICFIGIDGSGKSTLAKTLIKNMREHGIKTEYTWCKFESSLLKVLIFIKNKLFVQEDDWKKNYEISLEIKKNLFKKRFAYVLYECFVLLDYRFQIIRKIIIPLKFGKNLVCDRYIYDTIVDLAVDLDYSGEKVKNRIDQLLDFSPKPDLVFLVDLPEDVAFSRKNDVPSVKFLYEKRKIYKKIREEFEMVNLDGTKSLQELNERIEKEVIKLQVTKERCVLNE